MAALTYTGNESFLGVLKSKSDYDYYRGIMWANMATLVDAITNYRDAGQLNSSILQEYVDAMAEILGRFNDVTNNTAQRVDSNWMNPRFHDYYDFMNNILNGWRNELATMNAPVYVAPPDAYVQPVDVYVPPVDTTPVIQPVVPVSNDDRKEGGMGALFATLASTFTSAIKKLNPTDWFGKSKDKTNYDNYRATVWQSMASIVDQLTVIRQAGKMDYTTLKTSIDGLTQILAQFKTYSEGVAPHIGADWVMPRFHDYYDFMNGQLNGWRNELLTLPSPGILGSLFGTTPVSQVNIPGIPSATSSAPNQASIASVFTQQPLLVLGLVAAAVMFLGHKQR